MPTDNEPLIPVEIANKAIFRNRDIASRIHWMLVFFQSGRFEDALELANNLVKGLADTDAALLTLRDAVKNAPGDVLDAELPYIYTTDHKCVLCDNPLRYPLVWNRTTKDTGEHICSFGECGVEEDDDLTGHERLDTYSSLPPEEDEFNADDAEPDCDTAG